MGQANSMEDQHLDGGPTSGGPTGGGPHSQHAPMHDHPTGHANDTARNATPNSQAAPHQPHAGGEGQAQPAVVRREDSGNDFAMSIADGGVASGVAAPSPHASTHTPSLSVGLSSPSTGAGDPQLPSPPNTQPKIETVPTAFKWVHGGNEVYVTGSFNAWQGKILMYPNEDCWAAGTQLMLYDGRLKSVESIKESDVLMGDDSTPRHIRPGSLSRPRGIGYEIIRHDVGLDRFTVNSSHVLVLRLANHPTIRHNTIANTYSIGVYVLRPAPHKAHLGMQVPVEYTRATFLTREAAEHHLRLANDDQPMTRESNKCPTLEFEVTVEDYLALNESIKSNCVMFQPRLVTFPPSSDSLDLDSLLARELSRSDVDVDTTPELVRQTAWMIGMWLTRGEADSATIGRIVLDAANSAESHGPIVEEINRWLQTVYPTETTQMLESRFTKLECAIVGSSDLFSVDCGPVLSGILSTLGLLHRPPRLSTQLLTSSVDTRRALLAGIIDGAGAYSPSHGEFVVALKERSLIDELIRLVRALGFATRIEEDQTEKMSVAHSTLVHIIGDELHLLDMILPSNRVADSTTALLDSSSSPRDHRCSGFHIDPTPNECDFFGFKLDGNGRCLLSDCTVTHNSEFTLLIDIPPGTHHYKYIVDQEWRLDEDAPTMQIANVWNNVVEVKRPVFEYTPSNFADSDDDEVDERKQKANYGQRAPLSNDYVNDPPKLPPHLTDVLLNQIQPQDPNMLPVPLHVVLNHLYVMHHNDPNVLVTGLTQRFKPNPHTKITHKFVTTVYYAPINTQGTQPAVGGTAGGVTPTQVQGAPNNLTFGGNMQLTPQPTTPNTSNSAGPPMMAMQNNYLHPNDAAMGVTHQMR